MEYHNGYLNRAKSLTKDLEKLTKFVTHCINECDGFPIHLRDLQELVDNFMYLNFMHNALQDYSRKPFPKKRAKKKSK